MKVFEYRYQISEKDILAATDFNFPYSKILQLKYNKNNRDREAITLAKEFRILVNYICQSYPDITLDKIQEDIVQLAKQFRRDNPYHFPERAGWYDKKSYLLDNKELARYRIYWNNYKKNNFTNNRVWEQLAKTIVVGKKCKFARLTLILLPYCRCEDCRRNCNLPGLIN